MVLYDKHPTPEILQRLRLYEHFHLRRTYNETEGHRRHVKTDTHSLNVSKVLMNILVSPRGISQTGMFLQSVIWQGLIRIFFFKGKLY